MNHLGSFALLFAGKAADVDRRLLPLSRRYRYVGVALPQLKDESSLPVVIVSTLVRILPFFATIAVGATSVIGLAICIVLPFLVLVLVAAVTFRVGNMKASVQFYRDVLGMELLYGEEGADFSSLRAKDAQYPILNLEQGRPVTAWGRMIFYVADVDAFWEYLREKGFDPFAGVRILES